ncbi:MAG: hypothetical protein ACKO32_03195 [Planctomycetia bacterium]
MAVLLLAPSAQSAQRPQLPEGSAAERVLATLPDNQPLERLPALDPSHAQAWATWLQALESARTGGAAAAHAQLCDFALSQGRYERAWEHLVAAQARPELMAGLLPRFLPGVESLAQPLSDGATLRPALPPRTGRGLPGRIERREMQLERLAIGAARVKLAVRVEYEGVIVELTHQEGPACVVHVEIPQDPDFAFGLEYLDWYPIETPAGNALGEAGSGRARRVELAPGSDTRTLYGRFEPRAFDFPRRLPPAKPELLQREGLAIELLPGDPRREFFQELAGAFARAPLRVDACIFERGATRPAGIHIDLARPQDQPRRLALLADAIEAFVSRN